MAILKRIKASTLMETLVAFILIVIIFMVSSLILNNVFSNSIKNNTHLIENRIHELHYLNLNQKISFPYKETFSNWEITIKKVKDNNVELALVEAQNIVTQKKYKKTLH